MSDLQDLQAGIQALQSWGFTQHEIDLVLQTAAEYAYGGGSQAAFNRAWQAVWTIKADPSFTADEKQMILSGADLSTVQATQTQIRQTKQPITPTPGAPPTPTTPPPNPESGPTQAQTTARDTINATLDQYGLSSLTDWAWTQVVNGASAEQVIQSLRQTPEYQARFPAMQALSQQGHAITEAQYISYENQASQAEHTYGLPQGFLSNPTQIASLLTNNVSANELNQRLSAYSQEAFSQPVETRQALKDLYGVDEGHLMAYAIDPTRALPVIQQQFQASQAAGAGISTGFGELNQTQAERLAGLGISQAQVQSGLSTLAGQKELMNPLDSGEQAITADQQLEGQFAGNAADQAAIQARQARRVAQFNQGGQFAGSNQGVAGV